METTNIGRNMTPDAFARAVFERLAAAGELQDGRSIAYVIEYGLAWAFDQARRGRLAGRTGARYDAGSITPTRFGELAGVAVHQTLYVNGLYPTQSHGWISTGAFSEALAAATSTVFEMYQSAVRAGR